MFTFTTSMPKQTKCNPFKRHGVFVRGYKMTGKVQIRAAETSLNLFNIQKPKGVLAYTEDGLGGKGLDFITPVD